MKLLCVLLPHFPWRCEFRRSLIPFDKPAIVSYTEGSQKMVTDFSPDIEGLLPDMPLQAALARHGDARIIHADIPYYWSAFNHILDRLEQISPLVEGPELGAIYIDMDGMHIIYPDDRDLISAVKNIVADFAPQMGVASNKFLASMAARYSSGKECKVLGKDVAGFLKDLPVDVLPVSLKSRSKLREFGLATLGQVAAVPSGPCQSQFGPEGKRIWELVRGIDNTHLYPRYMEENINENAALPSVTVSLDVIIVSIESLLARLFDGNTFKGKGIRSLAVWTRTWNAEHWEKVINFKEPALDVRSVISRVKRTMEEYPQPGPVEQAGLRITGLGYPHGRQKSLFRDLRAKEHLAEDIKQLELKLGNPQVYTVKEVEPWSRIPERRYTLIPANR